MIVLQSLRKITTETEFAGLSLKKLKQMLFSVEGGRHLQPQKVTTEVTLVHITQTCYKTSRTKSYLAT